jgi:glutathione S-transferase
MYVRSAAIGTPGLLQYPALSTWGPDFRQTPQRLASILEPDELKLYDRDPVTRLAPPEYKALHPSGTAPVIRDGDRVISESSAIVEYVINVYGGGRLTVKPGAPNYADFLQWFHYANGTFQPASHVVLMFSLAGATEAGTAVVA